MRANCKLGWIRNVLRRNLDLSEVDTIDGCNTSKQEKKKCPVLEFQELNACINSFIAELDVC